MLGARASAYHIEGVVNDTHRAVILAVPSVVHSLPYVVLVTRVSVKPKPDWVRRFLVEQARAKRRSVTGALKKDGI